ncbi:uncharacterized protein LOC124155026 [Ischnura elegans]|uniref:uncharacterized protein LOC124155026 n=1 Tax=Ischnura elegans TaxID=197161 RepID=UPI001ED8872B|nr:uncharacterized protein LOC124155026 [Ischnura elegans]
MDNDFLHVPKDALGGLRSVAFSPKCNDLSCTEMYRKRPRGTILLSSMTSEDWFVSTSPCSAHVFVDHDVNRWPQSLLKVECACEDIKCSDRGPHTCVTVSAPVVLRRWTDGDVWRASEEEVPVGCVCASMRGRLVHHSLPKIVRR